jgi:hypothetical protein
MRARLHRRRQRGITQDEYNAVAERFAAAVAELSGL